MARAPFWWAFELPKDLSGLLLTGLTMAVGRYL
jgi:hypothetical protein